jgi:hypothetical protein
VESYGLLRDGTLLTVWLDSNNMPEGRLARRAFRLEFPSGETRLGRLPPGEAEWYIESRTVATTQHGFVVSGRPPVLVTPTGDVREFNQARRGRGDRGQPIQAGDVLADAAPAWVRLLHPQTLTADVVPTGPEVIPLTTGGGVVFGSPDALTPTSSLGAPDPMRVASRTIGRPWSLFEVGQLFDIEVAADTSASSPDASHAATWVCDEGGHGYGGDSRYCGSEGFAVTSNGGATWRSLERGERPFNGVDDAVAAGGQLYVDAWPGGFWRSTDSSWTSFAPVEPPARRVTLHADDGFVTMSDYTADALTVWRFDQGHVTDRHVVDLSGPHGRAPPSTGPRTATLVGNDDESAIVTPSGVQFARLFVDGSESASVSWPRPIAAAPGFLLPDPVHAEESTYLKPSGERLATSISSEEATSTIEAGDVLVSTGSKVRFLFPATYRHQHLWRFRPADRTFHELPMPSGVHPEGALSTAVDTDGQALMAQGSRLWRSTNGGSTWLQTRLPGRVAYQRPRLAPLQVAGDDAVVVLFEGQLLRVLAITPHGIRRLRLPPAWPIRGDVLLLADGRLLLGPSDGSFWRATTSANREFERIPAGPIAQVSVAGDLLYAIPLGPAFDNRTPLPLDEDRDLVWVSRDDGDTWAPANTSP